MRLKQRLLAAALAGAGVLGTGAVGCESHAGNGALIGGAAGAGIGAIIGNNSKGRTAEGALIGGAVGALGGGLIGNEMDKKDARDGGRPPARRGEYRRKADDRYAEEYDDDRGGDGESYRQERYEEDEYGNREEADEEYYEETRAE